MKVSSLTYRKCLPVLMYGLDTVPLDSNSTKLVTSVWNCAFRWLYEVGKFISTKHSFDSQGTLSIRFSLHYNVVFMHASINNDLSTKLFLY